MDDRIMKRGLWAALLCVSLVGCDQQQAGVEAATAAEGPAITGAEAPTPEEKHAALPDPDPTLPALPIEPTGRVETLPASYPESWVLVNEASFFSMFGGKVIVLDVAETRHAKRIKGLMDKNLLGNFGQSKTRQEFYILESFHERGSRGPKTDVLVIYDKTTLSIKKEIIWPEANRLMALPERYAISLSADEKYLYAANFSPAASFTVVDLDRQEIVTEIGTPGCVLTYPVGNRSVASVCSNGGMLTTELTETGELKQQTRMEPFFDTETSPIFEHPVIFEGVAYFPSFKGLMHEIDVSGSQAVYREAWDLVPEEAKTANWRPSGLVLDDVDDAGNLYIIFQPGGHEGSQTHGGTQVWVYNLKSRERVRVIETPNWAISLAVTRGENPLLVVTNGELNLDIFDANSGEFIQTVSDFGNVTPLSVDKSY